MAKVKLVSASFSLKKWHPIAWLKGVVPLDIFNSVTKFLREALKIGLGAAVGILVAKYPLMQGIIGLGSKALLDIVDYYLREQTA